MFTVDVDSIATLTINDTPPAIALSGAMTHHESATDEYNLTLGPITDPEFDTFVFATVFWSDGSFTLLNASQLAETTIGKTALTHLYDDDELCSGPISVTLIDEAGVHSNTGLLFFVGSSIGRVRGSMTFDASTNTLHFLKTGDVLNDDFYTITLTSNFTGFKDSLDGGYISSERDGYYHPHGLLFPFWFLVL